MSNEMVMIKTKDLTREALDWVIAQSEGVALVDGCVFTKNPDDEQVLYNPSEDPGQGSQIINAMQIDTHCVERGGDGWDPVK